MGKSTISMAIFNSCMLVDSSIQLYGDVLVVADSPAELRHLSLSISHALPFIKYA